MINLAVINLKKLIKKVLQVLIIISICFVIIKLSCIVYGSVKEINFNDISFCKRIDVIKNNLEFASNEEDISKKANAKSFLNSELIFLSTIENKGKYAKNTGFIDDMTDTISENSIQENFEQPIEKNLPKEENQDVQTTVIMENNKKDVFTDIYKDVQIKNESKYQLTEEMVAPNINYNNRKDIIIYHTHTCESYTPTEKSNYIASGNFRTTDLNYSVARVGTEFSNYMAGKGYSVIHDTTYHDYPAYTGSYDRSLKTITNLLNTYKNVDCVLDIHRDALRK